MTENQSIRTALDFLYFNILFERLPANIYSLDFPTQNSEGLNITISNVEFVHYNSSATLYFFGKLNDTATPSNHDFVFPCLFENSSLCSNVVRPNFLFGSWTFLLICYAPITETNSSLPIIDFDLQINSFFQPNKTTTTTSSSTTTSIITTSFISSSSSSSSSSTSSSSSSSTTSTPLSTTGIINSAFVPVNPLSFHIGNLTELQFGLILGGGIVLCIFIGSVLFYLHWKKTRKIQQRYQMIATDM